MNLSCEVEVILQFIYSLNVSLQGFQILNRWNHII